MVNLEAEAGDDGNEVFPTCADCHGPAVLQLSLFRTQEQVVNVEGVTLCPNCLVLRLSKLPGFIAVRAVAEFAPKHELFPAIPERVM